MAGREKAVGGVVGSLADSIRVVDALPVGRIVFTAGKGGGAVTLTCARGRGSSSIFLGMLRLPFGRWWCDGTQRFYAATLTYALQYRLTPIVGRMGLGTACAIGLKCLAEVFID